MDVAGGILICKRDFFWPLAAGRVEGGASRFPRLPRKKAEEKWNFLMKEATEAAVSAAPQVFMHFAPLR